MGVRRFGFVALLAVFVTAGCGGGDGAGNASCRGMYKRFADCGVYEGGAGVCFNTAETNYQACLGKCVNDATCQAIIDFVCDEDANACLNACLNDDFECDNGRTVDALEECDGFEDCADGADEDAHCDPGIFRCDEYNRDIEIPGERVCDGQVDCQNGSDEADCGEFTCQ
jgi:hypothetical protein